MVERVSLCGFLKIESVEPYRGFAVSNSVVGVSSLADRCAVRVVVVVLRRTECSVVALITRLQLPSRVFSRSHAIYRARKGKNKQKSRSQ